MGKRSARLPSTHDNTHGIATRTTIVMIGVLTSVLVLVRRGVDPQNSIYA